VSRRVECAVREQVLTYQPKMIDSVHYGLISLFVPLLIYTCPRRVVIQAKKTSLA
jgi:hypothetical protein